jgi:hypothetical protein
MAKPESPRKRVKRLVNFYTKKWQKLLGLDWFTIENKWHDGREGSDTVDTYTTAHTVACWEYSIAAIHYYIPALTSHKDEDIESTVVHEIVHCILASMETHISDKWFEQREYATEKMTLALLSCAKKANKR